jgi:hypothetical protein
MTTDARRTKLRRSILDAYSVLEQAPWVVFTLDQVAEFFGRSRDTLRDWRKKGMPGEPGAFDLKAILAWKEEAIGSSGRGDTDDVSRAEAERRKAWAEAKTRELELEQLEGSLAPVDPMIRLVKRAVVHAVALWEQAPDHLVGLLPRGAKGEQKRRFRAAAAKYVFNVTEAIKQGLIDLRHDFERTLDGAESSLAGRIDRGASRRDDPERTAAARPVGDR